MSELWFTAEQQRDQQSFHSLTQTLDRILSASPEDATAHRWRNQVGEWIDSQNDELQTIAEDMVEVFRAYLADRELENIEEQWGNAFDPETDRYFSRLFTDYQGAVRCTVGNVTVSSHDGVADFEVQISIRAQRTRGSGVEYEVVGDYTWAGRIEPVDGGYVFTLPFP